MEGVFDGMDLKSRITKLEKQGAKLKKQKDVGGRAEDTARIKEINKELNEIYERDNLRHVASSDLSEAIFYLGEAASWEILDK